MPDNASTKAADYATTHGFKILRVGAGMRAQAFATLQELDKELASIVAAAGTQPTLNSAKYAAMQNDAKATIADAYNIISKNHGKALDELAGIEWQASNKMINNAIGVDLVSGNIPPKLLEAITKAPVVLGHSSADWWNGQSADLRQKFQAEMAKGALLGETTPQLLKRLRGAGVFETPEAGSPPNLIKKAKRDAEALILTSSASIANHARLESFKAKSDLIKGIEWVSTLDSRTTLICMGLDGKQWRFPDMQPVGHDKAYPGSTAHWRCRSTIISVLYSWAELSGKKLPTLDNATLQERVDSILEKSGMSEEQRAAARVNTRASMDGQASKNHTYETWAKKKGIEFIEQVLGPGRASLYETGKMSFSDLTDQNNRPITLKQLAASVATGKPPPETLGVEFLPPPRIAKFSDPEKEAAAAKLKAAEEQAKADALEKANKAATQAKIAADKAKEEAIIAQKAAEEAAKQAAEMEAKLFQFLESQKAKGGAFLPALDAAAKAKGKGAGEVLKAYNAALDASIKEHLAAFAKGLNPSDPGAPIDPLIKKAFTLVKKSPTTKNASSLVTYEAVVAKADALTVEAANKKLEKSIIKKYAAANITSKAASITDAEKAYLTTLTLDENANLEEAIEAEIAKQTKAKAAKKAEILKVAATVPPPVSAAVAPKSLSKPDIAAANQDLYFPDPSGLIIVKSLPGSTAPKLADDPNTGKQWVLKQGGGGGEHLKAEATADKLYRLMGASVPGSHFGESNGKPYKLAEYIEGTSTLATWKQTASAAEIAALHGELKKHFVMDALLANWDVAGLGNDNILVKNGKPIRIDNGGSLMFRAQGSLKSSKDWGAKVLDLKGLRDAKKNPNTAEIFKGIKQSEIDDQIAAIVAKKDELVQIVADNHGEAQAKILSARIDDLAKELPATRQTAPKSGAIIGGIEFPPAFEEHTRTRFGSSIFIGSNEFEDQQFSVWNERDTSKNALVKAQGTLTIAGSKSFVSKITALGLDPPSKAKPVIKSANTKAHPEDEFWPAIEDAAKTVSTHAKDGKYNSTTIFAFNEAKKKLMAAASGPMDADKKAMLAHYGLAMVEIDKAIVAKTAVAAKLKQYEVPPKPTPAAPVQLPPTDQAVINGVTITRTATNRITYTVKEMVNGELQDTGTTNRDEQTPAAYKLQRGNVEITVVPYEIAPGSLRSYQGVVRINVKGSDPTTAIPEALAVMKDAGLVDTIQPTLAQKELVYLHKGFYLRDDHAKPEYTKIITSGDSDEEKVKQIKALAKTLYGVTLPDSPSGFHRYYNPEGEIPKSTAGARFWRRWDEDKSVLADAEKKSAFFHQTGDIRVPVKAWLLDGGHTTTTQARLRLGVPLKGGASSDSDLSQGGGNFFYTNYVKAASANKMSKEGLYFKGDSVTRLDLASHQGDSYGAWEYQQGQRRRRKIGDIQQASGIGITINTGLLKNGLSMEEVSRVKLESFQAAQDFIKELRAAGVDKWPDGRALEDVIEG